MKKHINISLYGEQQDAGEFDVSGERALWQSVIMQAVLDLIHKPKKINDKIDRAKTLSWFSKSNEDFLTVCSLAGLNPDMVINGAARAVTASKSKKIMMKIKEMRKEKFSGKNMLETKRRRRIA